MFLSVVIPTFNRSKELAYLLEGFREQVNELGAASLIEIIVCDDSSTDDTKEIVEDIINGNDYFQYIEYPENIGLEKNLIHAAQYAKGEYLWIFGDDDFLETRDSLNKIIGHLQKNHCDLLILNRTRRNFSLDKIVSPDWMGIAGKPIKQYDGLKDFYQDWGFISVIGFITVNIMRRQAFLAAYDERFFGTMYPQLGMMTSAFSDSHVVLISEPLICHRTQSAEEKAVAFANKAKEQVFMSDIDRRDALYFGAPYIRMINILVESGALTYSGVDKINENTVINGRLVDFLFNNIVKAVNFGTDITELDQKHINQFFASVTLSNDQVYQLSRYTFMTDDRFISEADNSQDITISVITPSYNQVQFFNECLDSVFEQSHQPIEHIVLDPGSNDGSLNVARYYKHVTLINEPDEGQGDAVAKGITKARGDIIAWVNSDDSYFDNEVFSTIVAAFGEDKSSEIVYGNGIFMAADGSKIRDVYINKDPSSLSWRFQQEDGILQPSLFFKKSIVEKIGLPSKYLEFCMDYEYWIRAMKEGVSFRHINKNFSKAYFHIDNKTYGQRGSSYLQVCEMQFQQFGYVNHVWLRRYAEYLVEGFDGVVEHSGNRDVNSESLVIDAYKNLLKQYNTSAGVIELLISKSSQKGFGDTLRELKNHQLIPDHYRSIEHVPPYDPGYYDYEMGGRTWRFDKAWKDAQIAKTHNFFNSVLDKRMHDVCIVVCNGPSLNNIDTSLLANADVIACNNIFLSEEITQHVDYYTCVNYLVAEESAPQINGLNISKVLPWWLAYCCNEGDNTFFVDAKGFPEFSKDIFTNMSWRHTVTFFNMHLAFGLGYKKVLLVGCDHSYKQPKGVQEQDLVRSSEDDENHFDPRYFKSKKWQAADVDQMEAMYGLAKEAFESEGREIVNCTEGGELKLFRCSTLGDEIDMGKAGKISNLLEPTLVGPYTRESHVHFDETNLIAAYIGDQPDGFMIDVGAHHGYASAPFLEKGWRVLGFEPDPNNRAILKSQHGNNPHLKIVEDAVSDQAGQTVSFYASEESTGVSGLSGFTDKHKVICEVKTTTLKDQISINAIDRVDFLKIDTEGFDLMVLKGFPWGSHRPRIIECEFENLKTIPLGYSFEDIADYLLDLGYYVYVSEWHPIVRYGIQHDWKVLSHYPCKLSTEKAWGNLLAFDKKPDEQLLKDNLAGLASLNNLNVDAVSSKEASIAISSVSTPTALNKINIRVSALLVPYPKLHKLAKKVAVYLK